VIFLAAICRKKCAYSAISRLLYAGLPVLPPFFMVSPVANGTIVLPTRQVLMNAPSILRRPCHLAADGLGPVPGGCGVLQVVKTAQSRGRTERTLFLQHFRNYCGAIKVARCGFPWEKTTKRPVASVCTNCETAYAVISALRRRALAGQECCGKA
jgi:hypothetical protein